MENYIVSARKYRPVTFESVVGQESITKTLRNAISTNHLAQAYLFCGPRGVGKTTCARIFAKTINCLNPSETHDACNQCESCVAFNEQRSFNIHELDAASNNSVDDIRSLIEQVRIPPQIGKYSVYIIDEVHMLSKDAFNALLKTLEEPPSYAIFILATTEKHKVIPTILSRCQIYDFSRITIADMIHHLQYVANQEGVAATEEALNVVAQKADGGMRDALSIFDQLVSFCGNNITYEQAIEVLNVLDTDYYFRTVDCALNSDVSQVLLLFNNVLNKGFDAQNFILGLGSHLRDLLVSKDPVTTKLLETSETIKKHYAEQAKQCDAQFLYRALSLVNECDIQYRVAKNKRLTVEIMLIRLSQLSASDETPSVSSSQSLKPIKTTSANASAPQSTPQPAELQQPSRETEQKPSPIVPPAPRVPANSQPVQQNRPARVSMSALTSSASTSSASTAENTNTTLSEQTVQQAKRNRSFTLQDLDRAWFTIPKEVTDDDRLKAALNTSTKELQDNTIVIYLDNKLLDEQLEPLKSKIVRLLCDRLQNDNIHLETKVVERENFGGVAELYKHMVSLNNELDNLRTMLNLEIQQII